jgi:hypothetical protein
MASIVSGRAEAVLYDPDVAGQDVPPHGHVDAWARPVLGVREVFHAGMVGFAYPPHIRPGDLIVDEGAIHYELDRRPCQAAGQGVCATSWSSPMNAFTGSRESNHARPVRVLPEIADWAASLTSRMVALESWLTPATGDRGITS